MLILSLFILYRGHNHPGGGFIGGLVACFPFVLIMLSQGTQAARQRLKLQPVQLMAIGLLLAVISALLGIFDHQEFMKGLWLPGFALPLLGKVHLGTPLVFDIGVYLTVIGFSLNVIFDFEEIEV
ncbi:MAG: MnhB domain-containing protein [Verrucomicrobiota bacterium]